MYNTRVTKYPYLMVFVESTPDVRKAVLFARRHNLQISVKSSGHDYIGRSTADLSLQIITKRMKGRQVNLNSSRNLEGEITVETGNTWIEVYREVGANIFHSNSSVLEDWSSLSLRECHNSDVSVSWVHSLSENENTSRCSNYVKKVSAYFISLGLFQKKRICTKRFAVFSYSVNSFSERDFCP